MSNLCYIVDTQHLKMLIDAKEHYPLETGGVLMGYKDVDGNMVVTDAILGGPKAERTLTTFLGEQDWQQEQITKRYQESGRVITYLGEWHTHPDHNVRLSRLDIKCLEVIAAGEHCTDNPLMIVLGGKDFKDMGIYKYPNTWPSQSLEFRFAWEKFGRELITVE